MSSIDLAKKAEVIDINLSKHGAKANVPPLRVMVALDVSGSMAKLYSSGAVERAFEKLLGIAHRFDDNGEIEVWQFENNFKRLKTATAADYGTYVKNNVSGTGGTYYAPVLADMIKAGLTKVEKGGIFSKAKTVEVDPKDPVLVLFFTDGDSNSDDDMKATDKLISGAVGKKIYFHLVGMGKGSSFTFLKQLADDYPNCGFINMKKIDLGDEALYAELITEEFVDFLKQHGATA